MKQTNHDYLFSGSMYGADTDRERARLKGIEALWDPGSESVLAGVGLGAGWRCLEVGAGGGSLVEWMAARGAAVTAIDIDTRFIEHLSSDAVDVHRLDIRTDALPAGEFDLIHTRLVLQHLSERQEILDRLVATLSPGGWIVIEDFDWEYFAWEPGDPALNAISTAIFDYAEQAAGVEINYGRRVLAVLHQAGLTDVRGQGRAQIIDASCPGFEFFKHSIKTMRRPIIETGRVSAAEADAAFTRLNDKGLRVRTPMMIAGIGRK